MNLEELVLPLNVNDSKWKPALTAAVAGVGALVAAMGTAIKATFNWAQELDGIGDVMDVTNEQAAAFGFIARKSGVDTATFTKSVVIMSKGLVKADGSLDTSGKSLQAWGIDVKDANGNLKSQTELMDDVSKKYNTFGTQQEKINFLTEIFGKSGAELVDFFDVMAGEGGIDAVTQKVKDFGLAIDPARYENFTRNLEEIKLMGLGLAVGFTEKVMPALEGILDWANRFAGADLSGKFAMLMDPLKLLFNLTDAFKRSVDEIDWATLSQDLANKINNIDWAVVGLYIRQGVSNVLQGIATVVSEIDWQALADAIGGAFKELVAGLYGYPDWDALAVDFSKGFEVLKGAIMGELNEIANDVRAKVAEIVSLLSPISLGQMGASLGALGGMLGGSSSGNSIGSAGSGSSGGNRRASGGAVIAGQRYQVAEFSRPETFTPSTNGRIDPMQSGGLFAGMGQEEFIQRFAEANARALTSAMQKAGRK